MTNKFIILCGRYRFFSSLSFYHGLDMFLATRDALVINGSYPGFFTSSLGTCTFDMFFELFPCLEVMVKTVSWGRIPIVKGSMGLVFLSTWMVDFYGKCRQIYQSHGWYGIWKSDSLNQRIFHTSVQTKLVGRWRSKIQGLEVVSSYSIA